MIVGTVDSDGAPTVLLAVAGKTWPAIIDTGFNGDLELPEALQSLLNARFKGRTLSILAGGQSIFEDAYTVDFTFDDQTVEAEATFAPGSKILLGTHLMRHHRLEVDFVDQTVQLQRVV